MRLLVLLVSLLPLLALAQKKTISSVVAYQIQQRSEGNHFFAIGTSYPWKHIDIVMATEGYIDKIAVKAGQQVKKGELIFKQNTALLDIALKQKQLTLKSAQAAYQQKKKAYKAKKTTRSALNQALYAVKKATLDVQLVKAQIRQKYFKAPFAGVIGLLNISKGAWVKAGQVLTTLDNTQKIRVRFEIPEAHIKQVSAGDSVSIRVNNNKSVPCRAQIHFISTQLQKQNRTLPAEAIIDNSKGSIKSGMFLDVLIKPENKTALLKIPRSAVFSAEKKYWVFLVRKGEIRKTRVNIKTEGKQYYFVSKGLKAGDRIVAIGIDKLQDGQAVKVIDYLPVQ